jgi:hypothetical protein
MSNDIAHLNSPGPFIVAVGNAFDGLTVYGPFDTSEDAQTFGQDCRRGEDWTIVELEKP